MLEICVYSVTGGPFTDLTLAPYRCNAEKVHLCDFAEAEMETDPLD